MGVGVQVFERLHHDYGRHGRLHCRCSIFISNASVSPSFSLCVVVHILTKAQDIFLYAVIVPVVPFALTTRAHVAQDRGMPPTPASLPDSRDVGLSPR